MSANAPILMIAGAVCAWKPPQAPQYRHSCDHSACPYMRMRWRVAWIVVASTILKSAPALARTAAATEQSLPIMSYPSWLGLGSGRTNGDGSRKAQPPSRPTTESTGDAHRTPHPTSVFGPPCCSLAHLARPPYPAARLVSGQGCRYPGPPIIITPTTRGYYAVRGRHAPLPTP